MAGRVLNFKVCSPLKLRSDLTGNYHAICHYSYNLPFSRIGFAELRFATVLPSGRLKSLRAAHSRYFKNATECLAKPNCLTYIRQPDRWSALSKTQPNNSLNAIWIRPCGLYSLLEQAQQPSPSVRNFV